MGMDFGQQNSLGGYGGLMMCSLTPSCGDTGGIVVAALPVLQQKMSVVQDIRHLCFSPVCPCIMLLCLRCVTPCTLR